MQNLLKKSIHHKDGAIRTFLLFRQHTGDIFLNNLGVSLGSKNFSQRTWWMSAYLETKGVSRIASWRSAAPRYCADRAPQAIWHPLNRHHFQ
jgi:hypothetical protein